MLLFEDEARFGRISEGRHRCWAPYPERPHAARQIVRQYLYAVAAVNPLDGRLCSLVLPWMDAQTMGGVLAPYGPHLCARPLRNVPGPSRLAHRRSTARAPGHEAVLAAGRQPRTQPRRSLWEHIRENYFGQSPLESLQAVEQRLCTAFQALDQHPETVKSLCGYRWIKTISLT